jgi:hypothetical protein
LAARAYRFAKREEERQRCQSEAAEQLVKQAQMQTHSAMLSAHLLGEAIAELHGLSGKKDRRTELRHMLIDVQASVPEEMSVFSSELDLTEIAEKIEQTLSRKHSLRDKLLIFVLLARSPHPDDLRKDAEKAIQDHPLASIFGAAHIDHEGKVIYRTDPADLGGNMEGAIAQQISQAETMRRRVIAYGQIDVVRQAIVKHHYISDDVFQSVFSLSPFIENAQVATFSQAFAHFFQGDYVSSLFILTPLLENSLRYVLKLHGHDVTIFDDATQTQEDRTISSIFLQMRPELETIFGAENTTDLENVFLKRPGPGLRNSVAHGLVNDGTPFGPDAIYACWLIFRLCCAPLFKHWQEIDFDRF